MTRSALTRVVRAVGVALLPAVALVCCAGDAAAGCGSYLQIVGPDGKVQSPAGHDETPAGRPCQGPECTGGPKAPAPVPPTPPAATPDGKVVLIAADGSPATRSASRLPAEPGGSPVHRPTSVFHPPRAFRAAQLDRPTI